MNAFNAVERGRSTERGPTRLDVFVLIAATGILALVYLGRFTCVLGTSAEVNRTKSAHDAIRSALEQYKEKFGDYPEPSNPSEEDKFAGVTFHMGGAHMLYQAITGDGTSAILLKLAPSGGTAESDGAVTENELENTLSGSPLPKSVIYPRNVPVGTVQPRIVVDGWGRPFQYTKGDPDPSKNKAINLTYDLWSLGPKPGAIPPSDSLATKRDEKITGPWIKNW